LARISFLLLTAALHACSDPEPPPAPPPEAKAASSRGRELFQAERPLEALVELKRAAELAPDWADAHLAVSLHFRDLIQSVQDGS
jgi:hypothetical protein